MEGCMFVRCPCVLVVFLFSITAIYLFLSSRSSSTELLKLKTRNEIGSSLTYKEFLIHTLSRKLKHLDIISSISGNFRFFISMSILTFFCLIFVNVFSGVSVAVSWEFDISLPT